MIVIGLTGGIGSGKSEVSRMLAALGAQVIDADRIGHQVYQPRTEAWEAVVASFGKQILQPDGRVDRKKLGSVVFGDPEALARLNAIMHPRMYEFISQRLQQLRAQEAKVVVVEAAVLIEAGWAPLVDEIWATETAEAFVVERVSQRNNLTNEEIRNRIHAQMTGNQRAEHATTVLQNNDGLAELRQQVQKLWDSRVQGRVM